MHEPSEKPPATAYTDPHLIRWVLLAFGGLFVLRLLGLYNVFFLEEDEISLAAGIAALVTDNPSDFYRYTPQIGYYRIVEWVSLLLGGDVARIPSIMKLWSAVVGALVPALGLLLFRDRLTLRERWLVVLVLAVMPILWRSSQYGNTAMGSLGFVMTALVCLSNPGGSLRRALGLVAFGVAVFVRADAVLMGPLVAYLLFVQLGDVRRTALWLAGLGAGGVLLAGVVYVLDPRLDSAFGAVATHMFGTENVTQFWEYLVWAVSPFLVGFAILGARALSENRAVLFISVLLGCAGPMAFYFRATTTPRYFLLASIPLAIAVAVGLGDTATRLARRWRPSLAWGLVLLVATVHLWVGLGRFRTDQPRSMVTDAHIPTHDGPMPTGALVYDTYLRNGLFWQSFRHGGFGRHPGHWEGETWPRAIDRIDAFGDGSIAILFDAGWDHLFHFYANAAGARYEMRSAGDPSEPFAAATSLTLGPTSVTTVRYGGPEFDALSSLDLSAEDEIWMTGNAPFPLEEVQRRLPAGVRLEPSAPFDERIRVWKVMDSDG